jgi:hypothetical protein
VIALRLQLCRTLLGVNTLPGLFSAPPFCLLCAPLSVNALPGLLSAPPFCLLCAPLSVNALPGLLSETDLGLCRPLLGTF